MYLIKNKSAGGMRNATDGEKDPKVNNVEREGETGAHSKPIC